MNEIEAIELLEAIKRYSEGRCPVCKFVVCTDNCQLRKALALLREKPEPTKFTKECRALRLKGATEEQWEYANKLGQACVYIDQLQAKLDKTKKG